MVPATLSVMVAVRVPPVPVIGDTVAVTPVGAPLTATAGVPTNPPPPVTVTVVLVEPPCWALPLVGDKVTAMVWGATGSSSSSQA